MISMRKPLCVFLAFAIGLLAQDASPRPRFDDFSVKQIFHGSTAAPKLGTQGQRMFRTMIRSGAKAEVEFAGHYTVPRWGCGTDCSQMVIVDSITGRVYDVPFSVVELPPAWEESHSAEDNERMEFHPDSRLMKLNMCPNEQDCGFYDYEMVDGKGLKLVRKQLLPKEYQSN